MTVLPNLAQENAILQAKLAAMEAALALANKPRKISMKVSEKGCLSVYGMNSRGIHLYASQWLRVFDQMDAMKAFIEANRALLSWKDKPAED